MATNPMQRKARNSFLLGILFTLLLTGAVIAFLIIQLKNYREKEAEEQANSVKVWVLSQDVISGQVITTNMLKQQITNKTLVPANAIGDMAILDNYALTDKEGNEIITEYKNNEATLYLVNNGNKQELKMEEETQNYYIETNGNKKYVELAQVPVIAKVDMNKNTIITLNTISKSDEKVTDDLRNVEYNMLILPTQLQSGQYIDVRLSLPSGHDYIVVSKKQVQIPQIGGVDSEDTIWLKLTEGEIITMNNAIVEAWKMAGSQLKIVTYTEAGIQSAATPTYVPTREVMQLISDNPNLVDRAKKDLIKRYNDHSEVVRGQVLNPTINNNGKDGEEKLKTKVDESSAAARDSRKEYLQSLSGIE